MSLDTIPSTRFASDEFAARDQFAAWRDIISVIFNVAPLDAAAGEGFTAQAHAWHLGELVLVNTRFAGQRFIRTPRQARSDLIDHYLVQFYRRGGYVGEVDGRSIEVKPGSVSVLDLGRTLETRAIPAECLSLVVPRDVMYEVLPRAGELHGSILDDGSGGLLADYFTSLERRLPTLSQSQAPHIVRATCDLIAACLRPNVQNLERAREQIEPLQLQQVRRLIDSKLGACDVSPEDICCALQLSRTQLYELFRPYGGVRKYIQSRRLLRIHAALADPTERRSIAALAAHFGFASQAYLSRAFRQHFGYQPSEVRCNPTATLRQRAGIAPRASPHDSHDRPGFDDWIRSLRTL